MGHNLPNFLSFFPLAFFPWEIFLLDLLENALYFSHFRLKMAFLPFLAGKSGPGANYASESGFFPDIRGLFTDWSFVFENIYIFRTFFSSNVGIFFAAIRLRSKA